MGTKTQKKAAPVRKPARARHAKEAPAKAKPVQKAAQAPARSALKKNPMSRKDRAYFKDLLLRLRDRVTGQISFLADDSLKRVDDTPTEDRTDDFDREFALNLVSSEHDALFEIDEALRRLSAGTYGICDLCGGGIEKMRLRVLPVAKQCVKCQSRTEKGRTKFRPFGTTIFQVTERTAEPPAADEEAE